MPRSFLNWPMQNPVDPVALIVRRLGREAIIRGLGSKRRRIQKSEHLLPGVGPLHVSLCALRPLYRQGENRFVMTRPRVVPALPYIRKPLLCPLIHKRPVVRLGVGGRRLIDDGKPPRPKQPVDTAEKSCYLRFLEQIIQSVVDKNNGIDRPLEPQIVERHRRKISLHAAN